MASSVATLVKSLDKINAADFESDEAARVNAIAAAQKMIHRLQSGVERGIELTHQRSTVFPIIDVFEDLGLWEAWASQGHEISLEGLAQLSNTPLALNLLRRLCRLLTAADIFEEKSEDCYTPTELSLYMGDKTKGSQVSQGSAPGWVGSYTNLPIFLKETAYQEPLDPKKSAYSKTAGKSFWEELSQDPLQQENFGRFMSSWAKFKVPWPAFYDTESLVRGAEPGMPILVDIGGNDGTDVERFLAKHPGVAAGSLILQDRPAALKLAKVDQKIELMPHDFFTPQPVIGSRAYFFHAVLHDWDDAHALDILRNTVPAMRKGYSKLLILDIAIPRTGASLIQAAMDISMMSLLSSLERPITTWEILLKKAGLKIVKFWPDPRRYETLIEAELE